MLCPLGLLKSTRFLGKMKQLNDELGFHPLHMAFVFHWDGFTPAYGKEPHWPLSP